MIFTSDASSTTECSAKVPRQHMVARSRPSRVWWRLVPSSMWPDSRLAPRSHRFWCPLAHDGQRPQAGTKEVTTWSPTASVGRRPGPTSTTTPAPSWPAMIGNCCQPSRSRISWSRCHVAGDQVLVGVAHAAGGEPHQHLARLRADRARSPRPRTRCGGRTAPQPWFSSVAPGDRSVVRLVPAGPGSIYGVKGFRAGAPGGRPSSRRGRRARSRAARRCRARSRCRRGR